MLSLSSIPPELLNSIQRWIDPNEEELQAGLRLLTPVSFPEQTIIVAAGSPADKMYFYRSGYSRHIYQNPETKERHTMWFSFPGDWVTDISGYYPGGLALTQIESLTPVHTLCMLRSDMEKLYETHSIWERFGRKITEFFYLLQVQYSWSFRFQSVGERYDNLMFQHPELFNIAPLKEIASFLGMTPETLSRLRRAKLPREK